MNNISFKIITPEKLVYEDSVSQVTLPTASGQITVLEDHIPLVSILSVGELYTKKENGEEVFLSVAGGFVKIANNQVSVLADTAERAEDIDLEKAQEAKQKAEEALEKARNEEDVDYTALMAKIEKELARVKVARKYKDVGKKQ